jgi:hypothetical protein
MPIKEAGRDQQVRFRPWVSDLALDRDLISARERQQVFPGCVIHDDLRQSPLPALQIGLWIKIRPAHEPIEANIFHCCSSVQATRDRRHLDGTASAV